MDGAALGFLTGILSSALVWFIVARFLRARVVFMHQLQRGPRPELDSGYVYTTRLVNMGFRDAVDIRTRVLLRFEQPEDGRTGLQTLELAHYGKTIPKLRRRRLRECFGRRTFGGNRTFGIVPQETDELLRRPGIPESIRDAVKGRTLTLEELLDTLPCSYVQAYALAMDNFSGTVRLYESPKYTKDDIAHGDWRGQTVYPTDPQD